MFAIDYPSFLLGEISSFSWCFGWAAALNVVLALAFCISILELVKLTEMVLCVLSSIVRQHIEKIGMRMAIFKFSFEYLMRRSSFELDIVAYLSVKLNLRLSGVVKRKFRP